MRDFTLREKRENYKAHHEYRLFVKTYLYSCWIFKNDFRIWPINYAVYLTFIHKTIDYYIEMNKVSYPGVSTIAQ